MLALSERPAIDHGLNWAFCDTDSMAFANTDNLPFDEFVGRVRDVCDWFVPLNPYEPDPKKGVVSILEMEDQNFSKEKGKGTKLEPLYCFAISAKRYALFNRDVEGKTIIRKASAHGLGHFSAPYVNAGARLHRLPEQRCINDAGENAVEHGLISWASGWGQIVFGRVGVVAA